MSDFNVMDMIDEYASESGIDAKDIFKKKEVPNKEIKSPNKEKKNEEWTPDSAVMEQLDEFKGTEVTYDKNEFVAAPKPLLNNADEELKMEVNDNMSDLARKEANIEEAKKRHGITKLQIPPSELQVKFLLAAGSTDHTEAQQLLDQLLEEVETTYPEYILERAEEKSEVGEATPVREEIEKPEFIEGVDTPDEEVVDRPKIELPSGEPAEDVKVIINKNDVSDIAWSPEEISKIKKSRTLELNIVEGADLKFGSIEDVPDNAVDSILNTYQRKTNDVAAPLPASKYRATFSGLNYPEVIDLSSANEINTLDGERKKWSIVFNHMKNVSIGPWQEYYLYKDANGKEVRTDANNLPVDVEPENIHHVTKFEDFLRKTSYMDLEFCLWKILCATAMDKEIITIDCHSKINGTDKECGNTYDWVYSPNELLSIKSVDPAVLEEMKQTAEAGSMEEALEIYTTSPLNSSNYVELHSSGFRAIYGHISAYDYLETMYSKLKELENSEDPDIISKSLTYALLTTTKAILLPYEGTYKRIKGIDNLEKVVSMLDEIDYETLSKINEMMIKPYQFEFSLRDIVCPKCKNKSMIPIDSMSRLLFIVARSLSNVSVTLKRI